VLYDLSRPRIIRAASLQALAAAIDALQDAVSENQAFGACLFKVIAPVLPWVFSAWLLVVRVHQIMEREKGHAHTVCLLGDAAGAAVEVFSRLLADAQERFIFRASTRCSSTFVAIGLFGLLSTGNHHHPPMRFLPLCVPQALISATASLPARPLLPSLRRPRCHRHPHPR
jgi:hypothetical protein